MGRTLKPADTQHVDRITAELNRRGRGLRDLELLIAESEAFTRYQTAHYNLKSNAKLATALAAFPLASTGLNFHFFIAFVIEAENSGLPFSI